MENAVDDAMIKPLEAGISAQERTLSRFVALLGTQASESLSSPPGVVLESRGSDATSRIYAQLLADPQTLEDPAVCSVPSFDLVLGDACSQSNVLPALGKKTVNKNSEAKKIPSMISVIPAPPPRMEPSAAVQQLEAPMSWTRNNLFDASASIARNVSKAFRSLVEARSKEWTIVLLQQSVSSGDARSRSRLLTMLSSQVELTDTSTSFMTVPFPQEENRLQKDEEIVLPLLFESCMHVSMLGVSSEKITFRAAGTASGTFHPVVAASTRASQPLLSSVSVQLDLSTFLDSMVKEARLIVANGFAQATWKQDDMESALSNQEQSSNTGSDGKLVQSATLTRFNSALSISSTSVASRTNDPVRLRKARQSAHKLNEILHNRNPDATTSPESLLKMPAYKGRKNRSVTWNHPLEPPVKDSDRLPPGKRAKAAERGTTARLRSYKSFGRPHAGDSGDGPRNATFAEFGDRLGSASVWGRHGKMVEHPRPQNSVLGDEELLGTMNAAFDPKLQTISSHGGVEICAKRRERAGGALSTRNTDPLPRTATALESFLLTPDINRKQPSKGSGAYNVGK